MVCSALLIDYIDLVLYEQYRNSDIFSFLTALMPTKILSSILLYKLRELAKYKKTFQARIHDMSFIIAKFYKLRYPWSF